MKIKHPSLRNQHPGWLRHATWMMGFLLLVVGFLFVSAQTPVPGLVKGFNITRYHPAPQHRQIEFKLTGAEARQLPGPDKQFRITRPNFQAFQTNGESLVRIESPECFFNEVSRTLNSNETLDMHSGDGRFSIVGKGFSWRQNEKVLVISNDVRAVIQWTNNAPPLEITSRWFEFDAERQRGVFHDNVRGEDTNQVFTCELLAVSGNMDQANKSKRPATGSGESSRGSFEKIEADGGLVITGKSRPGYAKAQRGSFFQAEQRVDLVGAASLSFSGYSGSADRLTVWLVNTNIDAVGQVKMSLPRAELGAAGGLLRATNAPAKVADANLVTLFADRFTRRGAQLLAEGAVRVNDGTNQLTCDRLEGRQATKQAPEESALATGNVFVGREGGGIYSDRAEYTKASDQVLFTGSPRFVQGEVSGTAGRVIARPATEEVLAEDNVAVTFPLAAGSSTFLDFLPNEATNRVVPANRPAQKVAITARVFRLQGPLAVFAGNVEAHQLPADGSEPRLHCGELEVRLAADKRRAESLQARQDVVCERGAIGVTNGPPELAYTRMECATLTATAQPVTGDLVDLVAGGGVRITQADGEARGEKMIYTRADQLLKLVGQSVIDRPEALYTSSQGLTWHIATKQVLGSYDSVKVKPAALKAAGESEKLP